jgi:hypothetical protein
MALVYRPVGKQLSLITFLHLFAIAVMSFQSISRVFRVCAALCGLPIALHPALCRAQNAADSSRQSLSDAWWTGPIAASGAGTLPRGHLLIEPYFYDVRAGNANGFGTRTYVIYGLMDRVSVGVIPTFGYNRLRDGRSSSGIGSGDQTLLGQYRLTQFREGSWVPTISAVVQETFPTGKYDRLGARPSDGLGAGAYTTTLGLYSQTYFWMPNGRILRTRLDLSQTFSNNANVRDESVYGTTTGFRGRAKPGPTFFADAAVEYSVTRKLVLALDVIYGQNASTSVTGHNILAEQAQSSPIVQMSSGWSDFFGYIPAVEYNWTSTFGVIFGVRKITPGRNSGGSVTPVMAINFVR